MSLEDWKTADPLTQQKVEEIVDALRSLGQEQKKVFTGYPDLKNVDEARDPSNECVSLPLKGGRVYFAFPNENFWVQVDVPHRVIYLGYHTYETKIGEVTTGFSKPFINVNLGHWGQEVTALKAMYRNRLTNEDLLSKAIEDLS